MRPPTAPEDGAQDCPLPERGALAASTPLRGCGSAPVPAQSRLSHCLDQFQVPDFNTMYELYDPCTVMFFYRNKVPRTCTTGLGVGG